MKPNTILFLIILGAICLGVALTDLLIYNPKVYENYFNAFHWWGKIAFIGVVAILVWIIWKYAIKGLFKKK